MWEWLRKKAKAEPNSVAALDAARDIVDQFDHYLARCPIGFEIRDTAVLPLGKGEILKALRLERSADTRPEVRDYLAEIAIKLAHFQVDVGERELSPMPPAFIEPGSIDRADNDTLMRIMDGHAPEARRYFSFSERVEAERREIGQLLRKDDQMVSEMAHQSRL